MSDSDVTDERGPMGLEHIAPGSPEWKACGAVELALEALQECPASRENSLAFTNLQQTQMWATRDLLIKHAGLDPKQPRLQRGSTADTTEPATG